MKMQSLVRLIYPPQCLLCGERLDQEFSLCGACIAHTPFALGLSCDQCAAPLPGTSDQAELCDDCMATPPPWARARIALTYDRQARHVVMAIKHGDRTDLARPAGGWMAQAAADLITPDSVLVPVPLHWSRMIKRRYNQSALLAASMARNLSVPVMPDLLVRTRRTASLDKRSPAERSAILAGAIAMNPRRSCAERHVILVDDVLTTGATLRECTRVVMEAGAASVDVVALARAGQTH